MIPEVKKNIQKFLKIAEVKSRNYKHKYCEMSDCIEKTNGLSLETIKTDTKDTGRWLQQLFTPAPSK